MKILYTVLCLFFTVCVFSQDVPSIDSTKSKAIATGSYEFTASVPKKRAVQFDENNDTILVKRGRKVRLEFEDKDSVYFSYWLFNEKKNSTLRQKYNGESTENGNDSILKIFHMKKSYFDELTRPLYSRYKGTSFGAYTIPLRLRGIGASGDNFDFEASLSLQANLIFGIGSIYNTESWLDLSVGLGITGINLNESNAKLITNDEVLSSQPFDERTANAFTFSFGSVFKANRYANLGVFVGWDFLGVNDNEIDWEHDGNVWLGLGINVTFNEVDTDKPAKGNQKKEN